MNTIMKPELVINALLISDDNTENYYEFVLDENLNVVECGYVDSLSEETITSIPKFASALHGFLFELNHVRINPRLDNSKILAKFIAALEESGVSIYNPPTEGMMAICFRPIGELSEIVRFYINATNQLILLCPAVKLRVVK